MSVGFIGAGRIAHALSKGFVNAGLMKPSNITASAPKGVPSVLHEFEEMGASVTHNNVELVSNSRIIFLTTKASLVPTVLREVSSATTKDHLFLSVAAGVTIDAMETCLPEESKVIRLMTNTPCLIGEAATAFSTGTYATTGDSRVATELLSSVGYTTQLDESMLDAVCGLSGSGPGYVYLVIEALSDGGVRMGLPRELSLKLACQTVLGSVKMVMETGVHPGQLKENVCSPGGSTITALHGLENSGFRGMLIDAVQAATKRTTELSDLANQGVEFRQRLPQHLTNGNNNK